MTDAVASVVDVVFPVNGASLPRDHRRGLSDALSQALPWLAGLPGAGLHRINIVHGLDSQALLSHRARLILRVPRAQAQGLDALAGSVLDVAGHRLELGRPHTRELLLHGTLYADFVAAANDDEQDFLDTVDAELHSLGVPCRRVCGRRQVVDLGEGRVTGFSLMLFELAAADSMRVLESGLGPHRRFGCGVFVPHRSPAAVRA